jgi:undecaprenyl diphosphate synthase
VSPTVPGPATDLPNHVAVIMDGNGRWAKQRGLRRPDGHREGVRRVTDITTECARLGLDQLTLYALSVENYRRRPRSEIRVLMGLLRRYVIDERPTLMKNGIRFRIIGRVDELPDRVVAAIRETEALTETNDGMTLCAAVNYGGRSEIADAARSVARQARAGELDPEAVDEQTFGEHLYTVGMPDVDLIIRTAGEMRVSNFLLWQAWYAELYVTDVLWPDFTPDELRKALDAYGRRERRFGAVRPQPHPG